jgi:hypothetical protein
MYRFAVGRALAGHATLEPLPKQMTWRSVARKRHVPIQPVTIELSIADPKASIKQFDAISRASEPICNRCASARTGGRWATFNESSFAVLSMT